MSKIKVDLTEEQLVAVLDVVGGCVSAINERDTALFTAEHELRTALLKYEGCGFCHGQPVANASSWVDGKPRPPAPCPRCGETNV